MEVNMEILEIYRYEREPNKFSVSPKKPDCPFTIMYRLIASEEMVLTNGMVRTECVDVCNIEDWKEIYHTTNLV